jgi:hypothetical protein
MMLLESRKFDIKSPNTASLRPNATALRKY